MNLFLLTGYFLAGVAAGWLLPCFCGPVPAFCRTVSSLLTGFLFMFAGLHVHPGFRLVLVWVFMCSLLLEACIDLRYMIIPDEILLVLAAAGVLRVWFDNTGWQEAGLGSLTGIVLLGSVYLLSRGGLGLGDVKLAGALGPWLGVSGTVVHLARAFLFGGIAAIVLCIGGKGSMKSRIPFGPFLGLGAFLSFFYSARILAWYWSRFL